MTGPHLPAPEASRSPLVGEQTAAESTAPVQRVLADLRPADLPAPDEQAYDGAFARVFRRLSDAAGALEREHASAPALLAELLAAPPGRRRLLILNRRRFRSWAVAEQLLQTARAAWFQDPAGAEERARLALQIAQTLDPSHGREAVVSDLTARAWCFIANARRIGSDLRAADQAFREAERFQARGTGDPLERARLLDLKASLLRDRRQLDAAAGCLRQAIAAYRRAGEGGLADRALIKRTMIWWELGQPQRGVPLLRRLAARIDRQREPRLLFSVQHNLVALLNESGRCEEAQALLPAVRKLAIELGNRLDLLRVRWLDGLVAANLGQDTRAEWSLRAARDGFLRLEIAYDVAMVSLDLAALYLRGQRLEETRRLAAEVIPLLEAQEVHREVLAAMLLLVEAAERQTLTGQTLARISSRLRRTVPLRGR